jgi:hypothetical protein
MEKLVWFKFSPRDWVMGKIQRCPEVTQARFIRLCCLYWNKECCISLEDAEIEIDKEHLDILILKKVILVENDFIKINFLDENFEKSEGKTNKLSTSGKIGNLKKHKPELYKRFENKEITLEEALELQKNKVATLSPPDNYPIATQSQIVAEKRREEESREDKTIKEKVKKESASTLDWDKFLAFFNQTFNKRVTVFDTSIKNKYSARLKSGYTKENIIDAMLTVSKDSFHVETNFKHIGLDFFARPDKLSKYSFKSEKKAVTNNYNGTL